MKTGRTMTRNARFLQREYRRALISVMISVLGGTVNTLIDSIFVTRRLDADALAAVSLNMPIFLVLCMVGCLFASGAFVAASHALGEQDQEAAASYYHAALMYCSVFGICSMLVGIFLSGSVANLLCGDPVLLPMVREYCQITLIGALPYILIYLPSYFLQLTGDSISMTVMMGIMIVTDILFDLLFLYAWDFGVAGAAAASVLSIFLACAYGFFMLRKQKGLFSVHLQMLTFKGIGQILQFGSVQAVGSLMDAFRMFFLNWLIYKSGGTGALAVWAVINSLLEISLCIISGIPRTAEPLLGIYISGHDNEGIRLIIRYETCLGIALSGVYSMILFIFYRSLGIFFKLEQSLMVPLLCLCFSLILEMCCSILGSYYNVAKRTLLSNLIMIMRTIAFAVPIAGILVATDGMIWLFLPLSMMAALIVTGVIVFAISVRSKGSEHELSGILLLDDYLERNHRVKSISIESSDEMICEASEYLMEFCMEHDMDRKTARKLGLALEETMTVMARKSLHHEKDPVDVRIYSLDGRIGLKVMCAGNKYDLFEAAEQEDDDFNMGVNLIRKLSKECNYIYTLGMNVLSVEV